MPDGTMANAAIAYAMAQRGKPYVWGAEGPNAYDCSGLVYAAYKHAGYDFKVRPNTGLLVTYGSAITRNELAPGDLVFPDPGHVQIYIGNGNVVEAVQPGTPLRSTKMWGFWRARRLVPPGTPVGANVGSDNTSSSNPLSAFSSVASFLGKLTDSHLWYRVGIGLLGSIFLIVALTGKQPAAGSTVANVVKAGVKT